MKRGFERGIFRIKNISGAQLTINELGGTVLQDEEEIDMMDPEVSGHYNKHSQILWAATVGQTQLKSDIDAGNLEVVESKAEVNSYGNT